VAGWHEALLHVDLTHRTFERRPLPRDVLEAFVGGVGLGAWLCLEAGGADIDDALDPAAPLVFASSPLVGTALATSAKLAVVGRSPLTGLLSDGLTSSDFAIALKRCGVDAIVVVGAAAMPTELVIDDGAVGFHDAAHLAGRPASDCQRDGFETAAIGVAGEHLVRFASISNASRHAGRGGLGAVMGAKHLKAISIRGRQPTHVAVPRAVADRARALAARSLGPETAKYRELGTVANLETFERLGVLPERNFLSTRPSQPRSAGVTTVERAGASRRRSCAACRIGCEHRFVSGAEPFAGAEGVRLEYESAWALGPNIGVDDRAHVLAAAARCDALGLDAISAGGTLAFAMEASRSGADSRADFGIDFGEGERVPALLDDIAWRRGAGELLAEGSRRAAAALGLDTIAMHVKGLELPGYDPRHLQAMGLGMTVGTRGADHNRSGAYELDFSTKIDRTRLALADVPAVVEIEDRSAALDSLVLCKFLRGAFDDPVAEWRALLHEVTGAEIDVVGLGGRVATLRKLFNQRAGWRSADDRLPERLHTTTFTPELLARLVRRYDAERGYDEAGRVDDETLRRHGLVRLLGSFVPVAAGGAASPRRATASAGDAPDLGSVR